MKFSRFTHLFIGILFFVTCASAQTKKKTPLDYVNPNIGGIGHLLVATDPSVELPGGTVKLCSNPWPEIYDRYLADKVFSFSLRDVIRYGTKTIPSWIMATTGNIEVTPAKMASNYDHDFETVTPYYSALLLEDYNINVEYTATNQAGYFRFTFPQSSDSHIMLGSNAKFGVVNETTMEGQEGTGTRIYYFYAKFSKPFKSSGSWNGMAVSQTNTQSGTNVGVFANYATGKGEQVEVKIGFSNASIEQAKQNLEKEIPAWNFETVKNSAKNRWAESLNLFKIEGGTDEQLTKFYTGIYFSKGGESLQNRMKLRDDKLIEQAQKYAAMSKSELFPSVSSQGGMFQHTNLVMIADIYQRDIRNFNAAKAYENMKTEFMESTKLPWRKGPATQLDSFYIKNGFFPAIAPDQTESVPEVHRFEKRQSVTVTLQAAYESWCVAQVAKGLGKMDDYAYFMKHAHDYQNVFNTQTGFMSPKTADGNWITPFNPKLSGGQGGRDYFAELNSWIYTWYVSHDIQGLMNLMGGRDNFTNKLDALFTEQYQKSKYAFLNQFPDQTGLIGNYAQGNEFSRQIPYLYNYSGAPWKTQKRVREIMDVWYGTGPLGISGDEDSGLMSHWYINSAMGIYSDPMIPNYPIWLIGSPVFAKSTITLGNKKIFVIEAKNVSAQNKYVQSATLNGEPLNRPWFEHSTLLKGGTLVLNMGHRPNKQWGSSPEAIPPSMSKAD
ncbi:MAG TPA: GH92 family glycosyl hydrolase [Flavitalea sp.]|nr:GH92 family glycosyl hydrolase [Flavitalea sp.]